MIDSSLADQEAVHGLVREGYAKIARVLKPGGRVAVSDMALLKPLPADVLKLVKALLVALAVGIWGGCSTGTFVFEQSVGPGPLIDSGPGPNGELQVFSSTEIANGVGFEFPYQRRTGYSVYDLGGRRIKHVNDNNQGEYDDTPKMVTLPPGAYIVKAMMSGGYSVFSCMRIVVERGKITQVHLDNEWQPPPNASTNRLVRGPSGTPVGWSAVSSSN